MDKWAVLLTAVGGCTGLAAVLALFVVPAPQRFNTMAGRLEKLEKEVAGLRHSNRFLSLGMAALTMHSDSLRLLVLKDNPNTTIETASEVLARVKRNVDAMEAMENDEDAAVVEQGAAPAST